MDRKIITTTAARTKQMGKLLDETLRLTRELKDAVERNDQVSMKLVLADRAEALERLQMAAQLVQELPDSVEDAAEQERIAALLRGTGAQTDEERVIAERALAHRRVYEQILELDRRLHASMRRG